MKINRIVPDTTKPPTSVEALSFKYGAKDGLEPLLLSEKDFEFLETPLISSKYLDLVRLLGYSGVKAQERFFVPP